MFSHALRRNGWAAIVTWALISGLTLYVLGSAEEPYGARAGGAVALQLLYLVAMLIASGAGHARMSGRIRLAALWLQLAAALTLGWLLPIEFLPIYSIIWLAIAPHYLSSRTCYGLLVVIMAAWYVIERWSWQHDDAIVSVFLFATFHYFALLSALETRRAEAATKDAQALNRELLATQQLLAEATKQSERTRIARDLHDLLGHHLTALTINLQVAGRVADGEAKTRIDKCHALSKRMLDDVRATVTTLRDESAVDFTCALRLIVDNIPQLKIGLDIDEGLRVDDVNVAESLLRCVQEAITNTLRHAHASECFIRVWRETGRLHLQIRDNGKVAMPWQAGNGLRGMRERVERINGELIVARVREALQIDIQIPLTV